jgi:tetratricopeptide (TPR) repeat protein
VRTVGERATTPAAAPVSAPSDESSGLFWIREGDRQLATGRPADAYRAYFKAATTANAPEPAKGWLGTAEAALALRRYSEASTRARRALEAGATPARAWRVIATTACRLGNEDEAAEAFGRAGGGACE